MSSLQRLVRRVRIARPAAEVFAWHERPGAFERLQPPWERVEVESREGGIRDGAIVRLRTRAAPGVWLRWEVRHEDYREGVQFRDRLVRGPFAHWNHLHRIEPDGPMACVLSDEITYALPGGALGGLAAGSVRRRLERMFDYRHAVTRADLERGSVAAAPLRVLVAGASGLVGRTLIPLLSTQGHHVVRLVRRPARGPDEATWNPSQGTLDLTGLGRIDAIINLAGAGIAEGRWSPRRRQEILRSRIDATRTIGRAVERMPERPAVWVNASAVGFYGDRGDELLTEQSAPGRGFLADVCTAWERELQSFAGTGVRLVAVRTGMVITPAGGALARMLPAFQAGAGGPLGTGRQWVGWITPDDLAGLMLAALSDPRWRGPVNAVAPESVRQADFARVVGRVLRRPAVLPAPAPILRFVLGELADELLLASARAEPRQAQAWGYGFRHPTLESALRHLLRRVQYAQPLSA